MFKLLVLTALLIRSEYRCEVFQSLYQCLEIHGVRIEPESHHLDEDEVVIILGQFVTCHALVS